MSSERLRSHARPAKAIGRAKLLNKRMVCNKKSEDGSGKANLIETRGRWSGCSSLPREKTKGGSWFDRLTTNGRRVGAGAPTYPKNNGNALSPGGRELE
jgi:hypothetical protein